MLNDLGNDISIAFQAAIKNIGVDMKNIAEKTKKVEDVTGFFKTKFSGKGDVKDVLSVVSVKKSIEKGI